MNIEYIEGCMYTHIPVIVTFFPDCITHSPRTHSLLLPKANENEIEIFCHGSFPHQHTCAAN